MPKEYNDRYADLVSIAQAARSVGKRREFVKEFITNRGLGVKIGERIMVPLTEFRALLADQRIVKPKPPLVRC